MPVEAGAIGGDTLSWSALRKASGNGSATKVPEPVFATRYPSSRSSEKARLTVTLEMPRSAANAREVGNETVYTLSWLLLVNAD